MSAIPQSPGVCAPTYRELIRRGARQHGARVALEFGEESLTFAEVDALSARLAHALRASGLLPGARLGLLLNNSLYSVPLDFACVKAALNRVPLNSRLALDEHARMLFDTGCQHLIFGADLRERAQQLQQALPQLNCLGLDARLDGGEDLLHLARPCASTDPHVPVHADDVVLTLFTSGTTGTLKAAQHTQASYAAICRNVMLNLADVRADDAMLHAASMIHASGTFVLPFWLRGARTVVLPGFAPQEFLRAMSAKRISHINLVPTMLHMLLECPDFPAADVSSLRAVIYGASPMPRATIEKAMAAWGQARFWQYYGQTEVPLCISVLRPQDHAGARLASCGQIAVDMQVRIVDDSGQDVAAGAVGEIWVRSASRVAGYHNAAELTRQTFDADGWVHTRDLGLLDEAGFLYLKDRSSDMIVTGGYNVYPREVEDVLLAHPAVLECGVFALPHEKWVESVAAAVVLRAGMQASAEELVQWCAARLAGYKKPAQVFFVDAIAKTAVGKLNRRALKKQFAQ